MREISNLIPNYYVPVDAHPGCCCYVYRFMGGIYRSTVYES